MEWRLTQVQALRSEMEKKSEQLKHTNTVVKYQSSKNSGGSAELCGHVIRTEALRPWSILIAKSNLPILPYPNLWPRQHGHELMTLTLDVNQACRQWPAVAGIRKLKSILIDSDRFWFCRVTLEGGTVPDNNTLLWRYWSRIASDHMPSDWISMDQRSSILRGQMGHWMSGQSDRRMSLATTCRKSSNMIEIGPKQKRLPRSTIETFQTVSVYKSWFKSHWFGLLTVSLLNCALNESQQLPWAGMKTWHGGWGPHRGWKSAERALAGDWEEDRREDCGTRIHKGANNDATKCWNSL